MSRFQTNIANFAHTKLPQAQRRTMSAAHITWKSNMYILHIFIYEYMNIFIYSYVYTYIYIHTYLYIYSILSPRNTGWRRTLGVYIYIHVHTYIYYIYIYILCYMSVDVCQWMGVRCLIYIYIDTHIHIYICICVCVCVCVRACVCVCVCVYTHKILSFRKDGYNDKCQESWLLRPLSFQLWLKLHNTFFLHRGPKLHIFTFNHLRSFE